MTIKTRVEKVNNRKKLFGLYSVLEKTKPFRIISDSEAAGRKLLKEELGVGSQLAEND